MRPFYGFCLVKVVACGVSLWGVLARMVLAADAPIPAFPGAEGFGAYARGGRGGRVIEVTNLNDSGEGSLRSAMEASGPRIVVFRVSGTITLKSAIKVSEPYLTVAGQTSPGGIQLKGTGQPDGDWGVWFINGAHDIVLRYLRVRMGGNMKHDAGNNILFYGTAEPGVHDVIVDHCSVCWGSDTQLDWYGSYLDRATFQWNIIAEADMGQHIGGNRAPKNITLHHNLYANLGSRAPLIQHANVFDFRNNIIYNWNGNNASVFGQFALNNSAFGNVVNNLWLAGPESGYPYLNVGNGGPVRIDGSAAEAGGTKLFLAGNWGPRSPTGSPNDWVGHGVNTWDYYERYGDGSTHLVSQAQYGATEPFPAPPVTTDPVSKLLHKVLATVGACKPYRDAVDRRIIRSVLTKTGTYRVSTTGPWPDLASGAPEPPADSDHDGMPDAWERAHGLNPKDPSDGAAFAANGYTNVENYLNELAGDPIPPAGRRSVAAKASGPLRVHPRNSRYFTDRSGKAIYLTGSHTWTNFQDGDASKPPFDFNAYLNFLVRHNHNFIRLWSWQSTGAWIFPSISPHPWMRTGPGNANDGKPKFDLTKFNPDYFSRLRARVIAAREKGIYVSVMLFVGGNVSVPDEWKRHPFHRDNNVNGLDGDIDGDGTGNETVTMSEHPRIKAIRKLQQAYIKKVVDTLNDLDNVLFEVINEGGTKEWDWFIVRFIHDYEKTKPKQHPVGLTGHGGETNDSMLASPADWFSPGANQWPDLRSDPRATQGKKVSILDTDHIWGEGGDHKWVWKSFLRGHNPIYMDRIASLTGDSRGDIPSAPEVRRAMGHTRTIANHINLIEMTPHNELASTAYCLAHPGKEYLVYLPEGGTATVDLTAAQGFFTARWFNPRDGEFGKAFKIQAGEKREFKAPDDNDWVLHLKAQVR